MSVIPACACHPLFFLQTTLGVETCIPCHRKCANCTDASTCISCLYSPTRDLSTVSCTCLPGYLEENLRDCTKCVPKC